MFNYGKGIEHRGMDHNNHIIGDVPHPISQRIVWYKKPHGFIPDSPHESGRNLCHRMVHYQDILPLTENTMIILSNLVSVGIPIRTLF